MNAGVKLGELWCFGPQKFRNSRWLRCHWSKYALRHDLSFCHLTFQKLLPFDFEKMKITPKASCNLRMVDCFPCAPFPQRTSSWLRDVEHPSGVRLTEPQVGPKLVDPRHRSNDVNHQIDQPPKPKKLHFTSYYVKSHQTIKKLYLKRTAQCHPIIP